MNIYEKLQRETFKNMVKLFIHSNPNLTLYEKELLKNRIDYGANSFDFISELIKRL